LSTVEAARFFFCRAKTILFRSVPTRDCIPVASLKNLSEISITTSPIRVNARQLEG
jgi:hypothetical protein